LEQVFDGVFDGDDVTAFALIDVLQHRSDRSRLARTSYPGEQDQPLGPHGHFTQNFREVQTFKIHDLAGDQTSRNGRLASGHEQVHPEAANHIIVRVRGFVVVGEVNLTLLREHGVLRFVEHILRNLEHQVLGAVGRGHLAKLTPDPDLRGSI